MMTLECMTKNLIPRYQAFKRRRQFCLEYRIESGGRRQTAFVLKSFLESCSAAEARESQSFSLDLKDQNY